MIDATGLLKPGTSCAAALDVILRTCAADIGCHLQQFMDDPAPDGPHKARVALRRLTTALDAFQAVLKRRRTATIRRDAKAIFRLLGEVRDADVYLARQEARRDKAKSHAALVQEVDALRQKTRRTLQKAGFTDFAGKLVLRIEDDKLFRDGPVGHTARVADVATLAAKALEAADEACRGHGDDVSHMNDFDRHEFRKDLKTLRYLAEFFEGLWPDTTSGGFLAALQALQNELGALNDIANLRKRESGSDALADEKAGALARADAVWAQLSQAKRWWSAAEASASRRDGSPRRPDRA